MEWSHKHQAKLILLLLLIGAMSTAAIVPYMGVYIVEGLGKEPWLISVYTAFTITLTLVVNRQFGEWIDGGARISNLILASIIAFVVANLAIITVQQYWVLLAVGSVCFSISNAATSTMYSYGRLYAEQNGLDTVRYNSYLRTMTSVGWMLAPALAFFIASKGNPVSVFYVALALAVVWFFVWSITIPKDFVSPRSKDTVQSSTSIEETFNKPLWLAAFVCLCFSLAHALCMSALPLFYIQDAGLPAYAPGLSFSVKTFMEVGGILGAPWLINRIGARESLGLSALLAIAAFFALSHVSSIQQMVFDAALEGLYYGIFAGVGITYLQSFARGRMARATSLYMNSLFLGGLISGSAMGLIAQFYDFRTVIQLASIWMIAAIAVLYFTNSENAD